MTPTPPPVVVGFGVGVGVGGVTFGGSAGFGGSTFATGCVGVAGFVDGTCTTGCTGADVDGVTATVVAVPAVPADVDAEGVGSAVVSVVVGEGNGAAMLADAGGFRFAASGSFLFIFTTAMPPTSPTTARPAMTAPMIAKGGLFVGTTGSACHELFVDTPAPGNGCCPG